MSWNPAPATAQELLSPAWLTAALGRRFPGIEVVKVEPGQTVTRVTTNVRFSIECAGGLPDGLPAALCAKGFFTEEGRVVAPLATAEVLYYRELADLTGVRTLRPVYADIDPESRCGVIITQDLIAEGGRFLDATLPYTPDQAARSLGELARLHAFGWKNEEQVRQPWLKPQLPHYLDHRGVGDVRRNFESPLGADVPAEVADPDRLVAAFRALAHRDPDRGPTVIHGDPHIGNVILQPDGRPAFVDWQCTQSGDWALDVGYHLGATLATADRRRDEKDLLAHYLEELRAHGVEAPDHGSAMRDITRGMAYGFFMWGITLHVDPAIIKILLHRLGTAVADHDGLAALGV